MEDKMNIRNVLNLYQLTKLFNVSHIGKAAFIYIEQGFLNWGNFSLSLISQKLL